MRLPRDHGRIAAGQPLARRTLIVGAGAAMLFPVATRARADAATIVPAPGDTLDTLLARARTLGRPATIRLPAGDWRGKWTIDVPELTIVGAGPATRLIYGAAAGHSAPDGKPYGTGRTASVTVTAPGVTLARLAVVNDFDYLADRAAGHPSGGAQAVALSLNADRAQVTECKILGYQDTLYLRGDRVRLDRCRIAGGVDFIFGGATARFEACEIVSRAVPGPVAGYVAAPSTPAMTPVGFVFHRCRLTREPGLGDGTVFLGRPWRAGGNMALTGMAAFVDCWMDRHIGREGWTSMGYTAPDGTRTQLTPQEARLFECASRGPGAAPAAATRRMLTPTDAARLIAATDFDFRNPRT